MVDQEVGRFEIAMQYAALVGVMNRPGQFFNQGGRCRRIAESRADIREPAPLDQLHRVVLAVPLFAHRVDRDDVGMIQPRGRFGFRHKPFAFRIAGELPRQNHLQRHMPAQIALLRAEHHSHRSASQFFKNLKFAEAQPDQRGIRFFGIGLGGSEYERTDAART